MVAKYNTSSGRRLFDLATACFSPCRQQAYEAMSSNQQEQDTELAALADLYHKVRYHQTIEAGDFRVCACSASCCACRGVYPIARTAILSAYVGWIIYTSNYLHA